MPFANYRIRDYCNIAHCCKLRRETSANFSSHPAIFFRKIHRRIPSKKSGQNKAISVNEDTPSTEVPKCCKTASNKFTFSTKSVLLALRVQFLKQEKIPEEGAASKYMAFHWYAMNHEGQYHTVPYWQVRRMK